MATINDLKAGQRYVLEYHSLLEYNQDVRLVSVKQGDTVELVRVYTPDRPTLCDLRFGTHLLVGVRLDDLYVSVYGDG